ncbi:uncharacterized protein LAJ45_04159 [Morchella importuna]|uniref:uncharacterized protein n=1 Tax=Morchella importuna TaxID=1174673 RepID=UPI001E8D5D1C|nr:uncharacterized protein LAJ45_04159 [Morchella importuna]KAH8151538.1 hypothetical protein LAJ45_04159 [Morchella importuna]
MPPTIGIFSRRKCSGDKSLKATPCPPQSDPYIHMGTTSSTSAVDTLPHLPQVPQPPHSAPLLVPPKKKSLPKLPQPVASGYASESAGLVFAPRLNRSKTSTFDEPPPSARGSTHSRSKTSLNRSSSTGPGGSRRTRSFDQNQPMMDSFPAPPGHPQIIYPAPPNSPVNRSAPRNRVPVPRRPSTSQQQLYSPVSPLQGLQTVYSPVSPLYLASPPLSPEDAAENPQLGYNAIGAADYRGTGQQDFTREIGELKKAIYLRDNVIAKYAANFDIDQVISAPPTQCENQRVNQIISSRVRDVQAPHNDQENQPFQPLHNLNNPKRESNPEDLEKIQKLKRLERELVDAVQGKERELEYLRTHSQGYQEKLSALERTIAQKDEELENARFKLHEANRHRPTPSMEGISDMGLADIGRKLMEEIRRRERAEKKLAETLVKNRSDLETVLMEEERKRGDIRAAVWKEFEQNLQSEERRREEMQKRSKEHLDHVLAEEEKRRVELNWLYGEKIENIELLRRSEEEEYKRNLAALREEKTRLEKQVKDSAEESERSRQSVRTQRDANEELLDMTKRINTRLGEEKKKNRLLEEKMNQISEDALNNVSGANREVSMLKNVIEDKDAQIQYFERELAAIKAERTGMQEAWGGLESELEESRKALLDRDEVVKGLEEEKSGVADRLEAYRKELEDFKQQVSTDDQRARIPEMQDMVKVMESMKGDIELYKQDVRGYKKDVKKRDNLIRDLKRSVFELESLLEKKTSEARALQNALDTQGGYRADSPASMDSSGTESKSTSPLPDGTAMLKSKIQMYEKEYRTIYEEHEALKRKHEMFSAQQSLMLAEMDRQLVRARREKDAIEASAIKQIKKIQQGFLILSQNAVAGQLAGIGGAAALKKYQEVPLPPIPKGPPQEPLPVPKRSNTGSRKGVNRTKSGRRHSSLSGITPPALGVGKMEPVPKIVTHKSMEKLKSSPKLMDDEEEVIEW